MDLSGVITTGLWSIWAAYGEEIKKAILGSLKKDATEAVREAATTIWDRVDWKLSAAKYQKALLEVYGTIRILGKAEPVSLEGIFTDVLILETPTAFHRYDIKRLREEPHQLDQQARKGGLRVVKNPLNKRIFILGKPGAGKTTFLKYLTIQAAQGRLERTPIFVPLKEWADSGLQLMKFLVRQFDICNFPDAEAFVEHVLRSEDALVLFDGLDEVNQEGNQRSKMIADLRNFSDKYSSAQCLITCRVAATEYTFDRFVYVELADFTDRQVEIFVRKWFRGARTKRKLFDQAFYRSENERLRDLARIPLLLSLLCLSFDATLEFPQRRVEIYEEALEALLKKWDASRSIKRDEIYRGLSLGRKRQMFSRIAAKSFQDGKYFFTQNELSKQIVGYLRQLPQVDEVDIDGDAVLKAIEAQHGVFIERAHKIYSFSHLTFQEYFTAKHITSDTTGKALRALLTMNNLTDHRWREVILLTTSLLDDADDFFNIFMHSLGTVAAEAPPFVPLLEWVDLETRGQLQDVSLLRAYYCYLVFSLIDETGQISNDCLRLVERLDRSRSLSEIVVKDTLRKIKIAHRYLSSGKYDRLDPIPLSVINLDSPISWHVSYAFMFVLTVTTLRGSANRHSVTSALRRYITDLRKYAIGLSGDVNFGTPLSECTSEVRIAMAARELVLLPDSAPDHSWAALVDKIRNMLIHNCNSNGLGCREDFVSSYFSAVLLLVDCLDVAVVSDRRRFEESLLLPIQVGKLT